MTRAFALLAALPLLLAAAPSPTAAPGATAKTDHLQLTLAAETASAAPGSTVYVALKQTIMPGWHTYWRNPGDSGEPTAIKWTLPTGWKAGEIVWPAPERAQTGPLTNYVFSDTVWLPVPIEVPADAAPGKPLRVTAAAQWLVCKDVCVPEQATLAIDLPVSTDAPKPNAADGRAIADTLAAAPKPAGLKAAFSAKGTEVSLSVTGAPVQGAETRHAWFYAYDGTAIDPSKPQLVEHGKAGLTLTLPGGYAFTNGAPKTLVGVLALGPGQAWEVTASPGAPLPGAAGSSKAAPSTPAQGGHGAMTAAGAAPTPSGLGTLLAAAGAAFLGGLILNLMPCVFPVLSIKAAQLVRHGGHPAAARAEGLAFLVGVVGTFVLLAGTLLVLRAGGEAAGWGFQLQNPVVVAVLALLMLGVALNLSGVFEIGGSVQNVGSGLAGRGGLVGALFTGALAVVVAAPCTAPFMAGAIGWAVTQPPAAALLVFVFLGLGLAAPFTLVAFTPALARRLPKPGAWMEGFRHLLAFRCTPPPLGWPGCSRSRPGDIALPYLFAAAVVLAFAGWLWGVAQRGEAPLAPRLGAGAALLAAIPLIVLGASQTAAPAAAASASPAAAAPGAIAMEPWSPARVAELQGQGRPVFVDFTAAWCVTCQVNERTALAGKGVADAFARTKAVYLKADWTRRDATIAQALTAQGRSGVPLYLVYGAAPEPRVLPQLLTEGLVVEALDAAAPHPAA